MRMMCATKSPQIRAHFQLPFKGHQTAAEETFASFVPARNARHLRSLCTESAGLNNAWPWECGILMAFCFRSDANRWPRFAEWGNILWFVQKWPKIANTVRAPKKRRLRLNIPHQLHVTGDLHLRFGLKGKEGYFFSSKPRVKLKIARNDSKEFSSQFFLLSYIFRRNLPKSILEQNPSALPQFCFLCL